MVVENADLDMYKEWFEEFEEKYKEEGYTVKPVPVGGGQIQGKQDNMMASGTAPDIIVGGDIHILSQYKYLVPLDELIKRDNADVDVDDFMPEIMDLLKKDGKTYYIPNFFNTSLLYYNILVMRSPNHYYYTGGSSLFKVFRLGIRLAIFVVAPLVLLSLGRTEGLFPRLKTPIRMYAGRKWNLG